MSQEVDLKVYHPYQVTGLQRIGNTHDGGYIVHIPSLQKVDCLVNYGVGYNVSFEKKFHEMTGKPVYAFDPTMKKLSYISDDFKRGDFYVGSKHILKLMMWLMTEKKLPAQGIHFIEEGLANHNTEEYKTLGYHLEKYNLRDKKIFLKIDIEGAEYDVLKESDFYDYLDNVVQLIFEFHYLEEKLPELNTVIEKLAPTHSLVHLHGNNNAGTFVYYGKNVPEVIELVFLNNAYLPDKVLSNKAYPVAELDYPCNWRRKDIVLDFFK